MRELLFEAFFALVECGHAAPHSLRPVQVAHSFDPLRLAYRPASVKATRGSGDDVNWPSGKRLALAIVLPQPIG